MGANPSRMPLPAQEVPDVATLLRWVDAGEVSQRRLDGVPPALRGLEVGRVVRVDVLQEVRLGRARIVLEVVERRQQRLPSGLELRSSAGEARLGDGLRD